MGHERLRIAGKLVLFGIKARYPDFLEDEAEQLGLLLKFQLSEEAGEVGELLANDALVGDEIAAVVDFHLELLPLDLEVALAFPEAVRLLHEIAREVLHLGALGQIDEARHFG